MRLLTWMIEKISREEEEGAGERSPAASLAKYSVLLCILLRELGPQQHTTTLDASAYKREHPK